MRQTNSSHTPATGHRPRRMVRRWCPSHAIVLALASLMSLPSCAGSRHPPDAAGPQCPPDAAIGPDGACWERSDFGPDEDEAPDTGDAEH